MNDTENKNISDFKSLLQLLELERRTYVKARVPEGLQTAFSTLLRHLNRLSPEEILALYARSQSRPTRSAPDSIPSAEELNSMSLEQSKRS